MTGLLNISSVHSHVSFYNYKTADLKAFFAHRLEFQTIDQEIINKYAIQKFNLYLAANNKDFNLWVYI